MNQSMERTFTLKKGFKNIAPVMLLVMSLAGFACTGVSYPVKENYVETEYITENRTEVILETVPVTRTNIGEEQIVPYVVWSNPSLKFKEYEYIWYYGYNLSGLPVHDTWKIRITIYEQKYYENSVLGVFDMTPRGQILAPPLISSSDTIPPAQVQQTWISTTEYSAFIGDWLNLASVKLNFARFLGGRSNLWSKTGSTHTLEFDTMGAREIAVLISGPTIPQNARFSAALAWSDNVTENITVPRERQVPYTIERKVEKQRTVLKAKQVPIWEVLFSK